MNECRTCGKQTSNPRYCSRACVRGKHTKPHTEEARRKISLARDGRISYKADPGVYTKPRDPGRALKTIRGANRKHILKFYGQARADGLAGITVYKYLLYLRTLSGMLGKDFKEANKDDLVGLCGEIEANGEWGDKHKASLKTILKKLYKIIEGDNEEYPKKVRWIRVKNGTGFKLPEGVLNEEDIREIVKACYDVREKSFIAMSYLTGCRAKEILGLRLRDVEFDSKGCVFTVNGTKTDKSRRRVRVAGGLGLLRAWLSQHPFKEDPDSLLFLMNYWTSRGLTRKINRRMKAKGFTKQISSHAFRRARATYLAGQGLNSFQLMSFFGWSKPSTALWYISLSGKQLDDSLCSLPEMVF